MGQPLAGKQPPTVESYFSILIVQVCVFGADVKLTARFALLISLLLLSATAFGQVLLRPGENGRLVSRPTKQITCTNTCFLAYTRVGIMFQLDKGGAGVVQVAVSPPTAPSGVRHLDVTNQVVAGVGAYGITIGMSRNDVRRRMFPEYSESAFAKHWRIVRAFGTTRSVEVDFVGTRESVHVAAVVVYGRFRTPEGITERSGIAEIRKAYGDPDQLMEWVPKKPLPWGMLPFLLMPVLGLMTGLLISRTYQHAANRQVMLGLVAMSGAVAQSIAGVVSSAITSYAVCIPVVWTSMPYVALASGITGGLGALVLAVGGNRIRGLAWPAIALMLIVFVSEVASILSALLVLGHADIMVLMPYTVLNAIFVLGMFLTGRPKQT